MHPPERSRRSGGSSWRLRCWVLAWGMACQLLAGPAWADPPAAQPRPPPARLQLPPPPQSNLAPGVLVRDFCAQPYPALCSLRTTNALSRQARLNELRAAVQGKALAAAAKSLGVDPAQLSPQVVQGLGPVTDLRLRRAVEDALFQALDAEIGPAEREDLRRAVGWVRAALVTAIDQRLPEIPASERAKMKQALLETQVIESRPLLKKLAEENNPYLRTIESNYSQACGWDGLGDNAFASGWVDKSGRTFRYVIVCPGSLLAAKGAGRGTLGGLHNLLQVLPHELGHHIDWNVLPTVYSSYYQCLADHHVGARPSVKAKAPGGLLPLEVMAWVSNHMGEISADFWSAQALLEYARQRGNLSADEKLTLLQEAYGSVCFSREGPQHPAGSYRIEVLLRGNPGISTLMGCGTPTANGQPACSLTGEVKRLRLEDLKLQ